MDAINPTSPPSTRGQGNQKAIQEYMKTEPTTLAKKEVEQGEKKPVTDNEVAQAIDRANKSLKIHNTILQIQLHEETDRKIVQIKNQMSGETIREFPSKDFVKWEAEFTRWLGVLFDEKI
jgi:uncharacterized FlaG/YvyC family protein